MADICLVTGVAGFIGSTLAERLIKDGYKVKGIDCFTSYYDTSVKKRNLKNLLNSPNFTFIEDSLLKANLSELTKDVSFIFHQAGQPGVRASWGKDFSDYIVNNISASQLLLENIKDSKTLKKLVFASSSSIYGDAESYPTPENVEAKPVSPYGVTKLASEHLMRVYASQFNVPTVSLRYFTVFGPRQRPDMAFNKFIKAGLQNKEIELYGDGEQSRDFTFVDDIVQANILAALNGPAGAVFNIGGGTNATVNMVLDILQSEIGDLKINKKERQIGDARKTSADTSRAKSILGFQPKVSLREGLSKEIEWMKGELAS